MFEGYQYNLVVPKFSKGKRNFIVLGGFFGCVGIIICIYLVFNFIIPILWFAIVYGLILMALSGYLLQLKKIGTATFNNERVLLENPGMHMQREISVTELSSIFVRRGLATNMVIGVKRKTLIVDLLTTENETVSMQIEVVESDVKTTDQLEKYFSLFNLPFKRKI